MFFTIIKIWAVALVLLCYSGWGLAHWLTPPLLRPVRPLLVPFFGYALAALTLYYLLWLGIAIDTGRWILLLLATLLNLLGWWFNRRSPRIRLCWDELGLAGGVALFAGIVAVLPLLAHGILAPIGASWDVEFYLPLATYLRHWPYARLSEAPANPLIGIMQSDPTYARAIGFSYVQGLVDSFRDWDALRTFAPMLGLMRLLAAPAVFLFARYGLRLSKWAAALAAILVTLNELLLWVEYTGFAMHVSSMPLIPFTLLLTILAFQELRPRTTLAASLMLAALAVSYHPGLLGYGALAAGAGLWYLLRTPHRTSLVLHGTALLLGAAMLTFLVQVRADRAFFQVYEQGASALGTPGYISLRTLLGLTPLAAAEAPAPPPWGAQVVAAWPTVINLAFGLMLLLGVLWLWRSRSTRGLALTMGGMAIIYALGLRYVVAFPYGHMKGLSFISFLPLTLIAGGTELLAVRGQLRPARWVVTGLATSLLLLVITATAWSSYTRVASGPTLYGREQLRLLELAAVIPPGAPVLLSGSEELRGTTSGLVAYVLRDHPLIGRTATGYLVYDRLAPGATAPYAVLGPHDDPAAWGFLQPPVWHSP
ncbi:MAG: hypothetical protein H0X37_26385, partial [Herpetosiphonaceae bacterium]|nr:hypothetical protein [Herpetosiphonaceae bacterium]